MRQVGIRELKNDASALLRSVRVEGESIEITYHGQVVARLVPAAPPADRKQAMDEWWARMQALSKRISSHWPEGVSAVDAVRDVRREL